MEVGGAAVEEEGVVVEWGVRPTRSAATKGEVHERRRMCVCVCFRVCVSVYVCFFRVW